MNHTDAHGTGEYRRSLEAPPSANTQHGQDLERLVGAADRDDARSITMNGFLHEQLARERHREAYLEARRFRVQRAVRAQRRARRATEVAVRAVERAGLSSS